jgi:hypothetical protein
VLGRLISCKHANDIIEEVEATIFKWKTFADEVGVSPKLRDAIHATLQDWN